MFSEGLKCSDTYASCLHRARYEVCFDKLLGVFLHN